MKIVDLSHLVNVHTPGWVGYASSQMYYAQNLQTGVTLRAECRSQLRLQRPHEI
jgi:hypothetical protein